RPLRPADALFVRGTGSRLGKAHDGRRPADQTFMTADGVASIQARIQEIEQRFVTPSRTSTATSTAASATSTQSFADMLSAAASLGTDTSTGDGTGTSTGTSALTSLLTGALNGTTSTTGTSTTSGKTQAFLQNALAQSGDAYQWGATASPTDPNPTAFDCSELVKWAAKRAGVDIADGAAGQYNQLKAQGATISVQQALQTPGALLFSFNGEPTPGAGEPARAHVAISLGNGKTIEARGKAYGVGSFDASNRFQYAAIIPGLST
ncbi:MAG: hypothetical protein QOI55_2493, partial [Actinomycetota bacterium]|nr:hypothetical protein [Actinomycetota bacterium]